MNPGRGAGSPLLDRILAALADLPVPGARNVAARREEFLVGPERRIDEVPPLFVRPGRTKPVSSTGPHCALDCAHCGGKFLQHMATVEAALAPSAGDTPPASWLLSGGCDAAGRVPLPTDEVLEGLARAGRINWHAGLADPGEIRRAARYVDRISFDFVGSDETIARVLGIDARVEDYLRTYRRLRAAAPVVPHVVVGLDGGRIRGEERALDILAAEGAESLVLLVLWPAPGTAFEGLSPPPLEDVFEVFARARRGLPAAQLALGCMRPPGSYRAALDLMAAGLGFDVIVQPTQPVVRAVGPGATYYDECCAFALGGEGRGAEA